MICVLCFDVGCRFYCCIEGDHFTWILALYTCVVSCLGFEFAYCSVFCIVGAFCTVYNLLFDVCWGIVFTSVVSFGCIVIGWFMSRLITLLGHVCDFGLLG